MNYQESLSDFFYNLVPGILFLLGLMYLLDGFTLISFLADGNEALIIFSAIIFGLFLGFVFQGITKLLREIFKFDKWIMSKIKDDQKECYEKAIRDLKMKIKPKIGREDIKTIFYLMHNFILAKEFSSQAKFYTSRSAFWSNMLIVSFSLLIVSLVLCNPIAVDILSAVFIFTAYLSHRYFYAMYDVVLKTYVMVTGEKNN